GTRRRGSAFTRGRRSLAGWESAWTWAGLSTSCIRWRGRRDGRQPRKLKRGSQWAGTHHPVTYGNFLAVASIAAPASSSTAVESHVPPTRDRKSTRLNSSHEWISYAVFCLKKKN